MLLQFLKVSTHRKRVQFFNVLTIQYCDVNRQYSTYRISVECLGCGLASLSWHLPNCPSSSLTSSSSVAASYSTPFPIVSVVVHSRSLIKGIPFSCTSVSWKYRTHRQRCFPALCVKLLINQCSQTGRVTMFFYLSHTCVSTKILPQARYLITKSLLRFWAGACTWLLKFKFHATLTNSISVICLE